VARLVITTCLAVALVVIGLPLVSGASWSATLAVLGGVGLPVLAVLTSVWLAGLWVHTVALVAAMPGLSPGRAFYLNLTGSAVSNVLPLGGAAGTAVNYWSCRRWGFTPAAFVRWAFVTNLWDNALRLGLPALAVIWLVVDASLPTAGLLGLAVTGLLLLAAFVVLAGALLRGAWTDRLVGRAAARLFPSVVDRDGHPPEWSTEMAELRRTTRELLRHSAARVAGGKAAYGLAQGYLLWLCLAAVGIRTSPAVVAAAFAVERMASLAVLSPAGTGVAEIGAVGVLVSYSVPGPEAVAGVLLYRTFIFVLEIPGGALLLAGSALPVGAPRRRGPSGPGARVDGRTAGAPPSVAERVVPSDGGPPPPRHAGRADR
jgi:uncharacterized membrane protein YbhN (UPF0104 family)